MIPANPRVASHAQTRASSFDAWAFLQGLNDSVTLVSLDRTAEEEEEEDGKLTRHNTLTSRSKLNSTLS